MQGETQEVPALVGGFHGTAEDDHHGGVAHGEGGHGFPQYHGGGDEEEKGEGLVGVVPETEGTGSGEIGAGGGGEGKHGEEGWRGGRERTIKGGG